MNFIYKHNNDQSGLTNTCIYFVILYVPT